MPKTRKTLKSNNNKTKKLCSIGLKPIMNELIKVDHKKRDTEYANKKKFAKMLLSKFSPSKITPENDFYDYINYKWLKNVSLEIQQKYIVQVDDFRLAQDRVYHQLDEIILDYTKTHKNKLATNLKNYYDSVIKMNPIDDSKRLCKEAVENIDNLIKSGNVWKVLAYINNDEMLSPFAPFVWSLNPDDKQPDIYRCYIDPHHFLFIDLSVYYDDGTDIQYKAKYRREFLKYGKKIFDTCLGKGHGLIPKDVYDVEVDMFNALGCIDITSGEEKQYNKVLKSESMEKYGFDWDEFCKQFGFKKTPDFFITSSLNYLKCGSDLLVKNWNTEKWRTYWIFILLKRIIRITKKWENISFEFYGKFERGQEEINKSDAVSASLYMSVPFNTFLTNEYIAKYSDPQKIEYVRILSNDLLATFKIMLERNTWLSSKTKKYAIHKLNKFKFILGKPENLRADPELDYGTNLYLNLQEINNWRHNEFLSLEGKHVIDIPTMDWTQYPVKMSGTQAYIVNASYTPSKNAIYINLGYIQKPFIDLDERGIEYNLAHIGFTLGHEMSHALDDWGSKYDAEGKLNDWWTDADKRKFKEIQNDIIKQYEVYADRDGIDFDAAIGIGEDMADISGLAICDNYLRHFQLKNDDIIPIRYLGYEAFYVYFAFQQRQFVGKKALSAQLKTNPHPLDKYRTNVPLSRSIIFRSLYDVVKGDGMWWHNTDTIW
jgi:putative endopeptidase